ncbi:MAG: SPOR domain-containing protein [Pseudomonadota bacterium]|nr:SPOR domain-containing protein [Pseudomonadota bacterium]
MTAQPKPDTEPELGTFDGDHPDAGELPRSPFVDGRVEGLFFPGAGRGEVLEALRHMLRYGPSLLLLYGYQGVGKHFLADRLLAGLDPELFDTAVVDADVLMSPATLMAPLQQAWLAPQAFTLENLQQQVVTCASAADTDSRTLLLVVRFGQLLDQGSVEALSVMLASAAGLPLKVLLILDAPAPEELEALDPLLEQMPDHFRVGLDPFTRDQTREYLAYRLRTAGLGELRFSDGQVEHIFNLSLGNAQRINRVAAEVLEQALPRVRQRQAKPALPWMHLVALAGVALLLLVLWLTRNGGEPAPMAVPSTAELATTESVPAAGPAQSRAAEGSSDTGVSSAKASAAAAGQSAANARPDAPRQAPTAPVSTAGNTAAASDPAQPASASTSEATPAADSASRPATPATTAAAPEPTAAVKPVAAANRERAPSPPVTAASSASAREDWLRSLPSEHYAIQLLGAREKATVEAFLGTYPSVQNLVYYRTRRNGAPWYVVVQASFPDYDAARAAVAKLPQKLQKQGPWIRKVEAIQKDL